MILRELRILSWFRDENDSGGFPASWEMSQSEHPVCDFGDCLLGGWGIGVSGSSSASCSICSSTSSTWSRSAKLALHCSSRLSANASAFSSSVYLADRPPVANPAGREYGGKNFDMKTQKIARESGGCGCSRLRRRRNAPVLNTHYLVLWNWSRPWHGI
jgi:hypothetical protein